MSWAYAMLLTTPLVVTVGISLTIPLSLIGEMIQYAQFSSWVYWVGAGIVFVSFVFVNHESTDGEDEGDKEERTELSEEIRHSGDVSPLPRP
jgi:solute carrier family 35 protein F5